MKRVFVFSPCTTRKRGNAEVNDLAFCACVGNRQEGRPGGQKVWNETGVRFWVRGQGLNQGQVHRHGEGSRHRDPGIGRRGFARPASPGWVFKPPRCIGPLADA